jgi:uncharacterized membrane protein
LEYWRLLAHNHWFTLNVLGSKVRLCARCLGYLLGFISSFFILDYLSYPLGFLDNSVQQLVCILLALPYALDWVTQSWGFRQSSNPLRLTTGILMGVDIFIFSKLGSNLQASRTIFIGASLFVASIGYLGKLKRLNQLQRIE